MRQKICDTVPKKKKLKLAELLTPDMSVKDISAIDFDRLYQSGYRMALLDVDNTLALHGSHEPDEFAFKAVEQIRAAGMVCRIISNGAAKRVSGFADQIGLPYYAQALKPSTKGIHKALKSESRKAEETLLVGDQLLTDVLAARRAGCLAVLVEPRSQAETWHIRLKRLVERMLLGRKHSK